VSGPVALAGTPGAAALALGTFLSEDLTCITAGLLVHGRALDPLTAVAGCFVGIYLGDLGLWLLGRGLSGGLLRSSRLRAWAGRRLPGGTLARCRAWFDRHAPGALLAARVVPGMRLPVYLAAGVLGQRAGRFALWAGVAALVWAPLLVLGVAFLGERAAVPLTRALGAGAVWPAAALTAAAALLVLLLARAAATPAGRGRLLARVARLWRWEFWPAWLFYAPVVAWIALLSIRYRGFATITAANPGIPEGGFVGESKWGILVRLPRERVVPGALVPTGTPAARLESLRREMRGREMRGRGLDFPLVLKPDAGQRGAGVRVVRSLEEAAGYFCDYRGAVLAQAWHPGPYEAGVFYYRLPGEGRGRIFSITDKRFPEIEGDGRSTLENLFWRHPRHRMQARTFLRRHAARRHSILAAGERLRLAWAGNHCQGTRFEDGAHLLTPDLERAVDDIARAFPGFHFGRFDVRYTDPEAFRAGRDLGIVELNGVTSESTNIYDPSRSLLWAYRILFRQWALLFRIGAANRARAVRPVSHARLLRVVVGFYAGTAPSPLAD
jgi:membrane protein DedA with SNARE-associated domain